MTAEGASLYLDYSKNRITAETLDLLLALAQESHLREHTEAMFRGERINVTENRSVLHVALRMPREESLVVDGVDVVAEVHEVLDRMSRFSDQVRGGDWRGHTGKAIRNVVNVGIGGSDLGPGDGLRGASPLLASRHDLPLRLECRLDRLRGGDARPRGRGDAVHHLLEDVHDARDDDQRADGSRMGDRGAWRRVGDREALRRRVDERRRGVEVRDRHGEHVRLLGLGRRALLDGLRDRPLDDARDRA